jgi:hypothetical protein
METLSWIAFAYKLHRRVNLQRVRGSADDMHAFPQDLRARSQERCSRTQQAEILQRRTVYLDRFKPWRLDGPLRER